MLTPPPLLPENPYVSRALHIEIRNDGKYTVPFIHFYSQHLFSASLYPPNIPVRDETWLSYFFSLENYFFGGGRKLSRTMVNSSLCTNGCEGKRAIGVFISEVLRVGRLEMVPEHPWKRGGVN